MTAATIDWRPRPPGVSTSAAPAAAATASAVGLEAAPELEIRGLSKHYPSKQAPGGVLQVLTGIDLDVAPGEFVSFVGASGCGKSTLLRLILGLDPDYDGAILQRGVPIKAPGPERGIVFQDHRLFPWLTVEQNIAVGLRNAPLSVADKRDRVAEHVALVGLEGFEQAYPAQLSGGMAQRVAIARGIVHRPRLLLLDEPFGALDALTRLRLQDELQQIWQAEGITMLLVTHDVDEAVHLADRVVVLQPRPGRIRRVVEVDIAHPRSRSDPRFIDRRDEVLADLIGEQQQGVAGRPDRRAA